MSHRALSRGRRLLLASCLVLAAVGAHHRALHADLLYDDREVIEDDPRMEEAGPMDWWGLLSRSYWPGAHRDALWRPATLLSLAVQKKFQAQPAAYHGANLLLHAAVVVVFFCLILDLGGSTGLALSAALLFAVHPLASEAVTLVVGRADLLTALSILGALHLVARQRQKNLAETPPPWVLAALAALAAIACMAKESGFILMALAILLLAVFRKGGRSGALSQVRAALRTTAPRRLLLAILLPSAGVLLLRFLVLGRLMRAGPPPLVNNPIAHAGFMAGRLQALRLVGKGLTLFIWPRHLSVDYSFAAVRVPHLNPAALVQAAACLTLAGLFLWMLRSRPLALWGALFFLLSQALTANLLVPIGTIFAERLLYLPMIGLCLLAADLGAAGIKRLLQARRLSLLAQAAATVLALAVAAALTWRTLERERDYASDLILWSRTAAAQPRSAKAHYNLGRSLAVRGRDTEAIGQYRAALEILPAHIEALNNLAVSLLRTGHPREALNHLDRAVKLAPSSAQVAFNRALALYLLGHTAAAGREFKRGRRLDPAMARRLLSRGPRWRLMEEAGATAAPAHPAPPAPGEVGSDPPL
ncbi:MAG: tetratricopeptide repeat protein [Acidobacteriota bacterium]